MIVQSLQNGLDLGSFGSNVLERYGLSQRSETLNFPKYKITTITFMFILKNAIIIWALSV